MDKETQNNTYTDFEGAKLLFHGELGEVILNVKKHIGNAQNSSVLIFSDDIQKYVNEIAKPLFEEV